MQLRAVHNALQYWRMCKILVEAPQIEVARNCLIFIKSGRYLISELEESERHMETSRERGRLPFVWVSDPSDKILGKWVSN